MLREIPGGDAASFVANSAGSTPRFHEAKLATQATFTELKGVLRWIDHTPIEVDAHNCLVQIRSEHLSRLTMAVARIALTAPVEVLEPAELAENVRELTKHLSVSPRRRTGREGRLREKQVPADLARSDQRSGRLRVNPASRLPLRN